MIQLSHKKELNLNKEFTFAKPFFKLPSLTQKNFELFKREHERKKKSKYECDPECLNINRQG